MTQRIEQEVAAAAAAPQVSQASEGDANPLKRDLDTEVTAEATAPAPTDNRNGDVANPESTPKRARFDSTANNDNGGKKKWERRDRRGTGRSHDHPSTSTSDPSSSSSSSASSDRLPKRKVAVKFGYCGIGYSGLQINPGVKTIEGDIFDAFCTAGAVSSDNAVNPNKVGLQRAARTDRGVHAAGNLLSLKLILQPDGLKPGETLVEKVNSLLPNFIRIWGITRVQNGFNARQSCDSRMYEYLLPTYVFIPPKPGSTMHDMLLKMRDEELAKNSDPSTTTTCLDEIVSHPFWTSHGTTSDFATDIAAKKQYRLSADSLARIRSIFAKYTGSHNFHNFTVGKEFRDRSCQRFMKRLTISDPKMIQGVEWVSIKFWGQSFMLHQIRKMIGLLVLVGRTGAGIGLVDECFGPARVHIPKAPGLGLLLENPIFDAYNQRIANSNEKVRALIRKKPDSPSLADEIREPITYTTHTSEMESFKQEWIYDRIIATEQETNEFGKWLNYLDVFQGPDFQFLNPKGVIPKEAIVKVGEFHRDSLRKRGKDQKDEQQDEEDEDQEAYTNGADLDEYEG
ncbi:tRNA pseudouridine synthase 1 [Pseudozyma hubeiensis]|nr:tRNA pseudouridine synthase 1 [Pseudozyma hubeiensis]